MKKISIMSMFATLALASCGTTYTPPTEPAPSLWQGSSGIKITGKAYELIPGVKSEGDVFATVEADHVRTARLTEDVTYTSGPGVTQANKELTLKAGTPLYSRQFTQSTTMYRGSQAISHTSQRADRNPIEWCAKRPVGQGAVCIFWQDPVTAFYVEDRRNSSIAPGLGTGVGAKGPMPKLVEDSNVKFSAPLSGALVMARSNKKKVLIQQIAGSPVDGEYRGSVVSFQDKRWGDDGTAELNMAGGKFKLSKVLSSGKETDKVKVEVIEPPKLQAFNNLSDADKAKLLELLMKSMKTK